MELRYRIAQSSDIDSIYAFAENQLKKAIPDDMERMIKIWESRFRKEALEHYLKSGWSFVATVEKEKEEIVQGFFLGQPLLFFEGLTQTLWVEEIQAATSQVEESLIEIAYKLSKDKHFQKVIFPSSSEEGLRSKNIKYNQQDNSWLWCKTTK